MLQFLGYASLFEDRIIATTLSLRRNRDWWQIVRGRTSQAVGYAWMLGKWFFGWIYEEEDSMLGHVCDRAFLMLRSCLSVLPKHLTACPPVSTQLALQALTYTYLGILVTNTQRENLSHDRRPSEAEYVLEFRHPLTVVF